MTEEQQHRRADIIEFAKRQFNDGAMERDAGQPLYRPLTFYNIENLLTT